MINIYWQGFVSVMGLPGLITIEGNTALINNAIKVSSLLSIQIYLSETSAELKANKISTKMVTMKLKRIFTQTMYMTAIIVKFFMKSIFKYVEEFSVFDFHFDK